MKSVFQKLLFESLAGFFLFVTDLQAASSFTFSNTTFLAINDFAIATPYPSSITVTGLTGLIVMKVSLQLRGLTHTFPDDIDMLLVGPNGQNTIFFSNVSAGPAACPVTNLFITLDDDAQIALTNSCLSSGTFHPTNRLSGDFFPSPAPSPTGASDFASFKGTSPEGIWQLYVVDDAGSDSGSISEGWSLTISTGAPLEVQVVQTNVITSWPTAAQNYILQSTASLSPYSWTNVLSSPVAISGRFYVTNALSSASAFYRLVEF